jgi:light-regulated signal transduction histidine kinase (bacteriophytochrome)
MCVRTLETGEPSMAQYQLESTGRWLELTVSKLDNSHLIHIFSDITPIKEAQLQLEKSVQELKRSNASLEDFAHAASHDMKEPLRKIRTFSERLKMSMGPKMNESEAKLFERIEAAAERMQLLVDDLLEFSHVSEKPLQLEAVDLNEKMKKILTDLELPIEEKSARIVVQPLPTINGHRRHLQQLFHNLIGNALKYSKADVAPVITISSRTVKGNEVASHVLPQEADKCFYLVEVRDNGIGFEQQYAEQIFEMFQRLHGKQEYSGTGVGLSIARKVMEHHHGYIWAEGVPNEGASFKLLFPVE